MAADAASNELPLVLLRWKGVSEVGEPQWIAEDAFSSRSPAESTPEWAIEWAAQRGIVLTGTHGVSDESSSSAAAWVIAHDKARALEAWRSFSSTCVANATDMGTTRLHQDEDVLDTWFSSGLLPLSAIGWPWADGTPALVGPNASDRIPGRSEEEVAALIASKDWGMVPEHGKDSTEQLMELPPSHASLYPFSVMETGEDIIFFWVARMAMMCGALSGHPDKWPFRRILLHGMVRDGQGRKMSKSRGNVIDPMHVVNGRSLEDMLHDISSNQALPAAERKRATKQSKREFPDGLPRAGADALRFSLCHYAS